MHLVTAEAEAGSATAAVNRYRHPGADTLLFAVVTVAVLLAAHQQTRPTRELWHCLEGLSIEPFDLDAAANWIKHYPGGLTFAE
ncbi:hypothetical protein B6N31_11500 [Dickeya fangzhongdai]|nr:hypothetical protein B6N31_11500 [Dickeya fangzhongdai]